MSPKFPLPVIVTDADVPAAPAEPSIAARTGCSRCEAVRILVALSIRVGTDGSELVLAPVQVPYEPCWFQAQIQAHVVAVIQSSTEECAS